MANVLYTVRPDALLREAQSIETSAKENQKSWIILGQLDKYGEALKTANLLRRAAAEKSVYTRREILRNAGYTVKSPKALSQNPRPRKYASDAERQAAYRNRASMVEFRADEKTAEKLTEIADTLDISRSDLLLSMVKFALTNHQWARFGLTHKTLPRYEENPIMATKQKIFMMSVGADKPKIPEPYLFEFTHYIPMNSFGGSSVAFKFVAYDFLGDLVISEMASGKKVAQIINYERVTSGKTDRQIAKIAIENLLQRYGADKVYQILKKG